MTGYVAWRRAAYVDLPSKESVYAPEPTYCLGLVICICGTPSDPDISLSGVLHLEQDFIGINMLVAIGRECYDFSVFIFTVLFHVADCKAFFPEFRSVSYPVKSFRRLVSDLAIHFRKSWQMEPLTIMQDR